MRHTLFIYDDDDGMIGKLAPFLEAGLADGEPVVVVLERKKWELLAGELGADAGLISFLDRDLLLTRPEDALARFDVAFRRLGCGEAISVRVYGEPRWGADAERDSWIAFEAIFNRAFEHQSGWAMCGYDAREVGELVLEGALETHPEVLTDRWTRNPGYVEPAEVVRAHTPAPVPLSRLRAVPVDDRPRAIRECLGAELSAAGVPESEAQDLLLAAGEVLANARRHGGELVSIRIGGVDDRFVCEIRDDGPGFDDPLAGFVPPRPGQADGAGLWVARQLTRQLELVPTADGFGVRLWAGTGSQAQYGIAPRPEAPRPSR
jgi:anti-sigma regulatory factor (Ser/Thr protein kinase)